MLMRESEDTYLQVKIFFAFYQNQSHIREQAGSLKKM